MLINPPNWSTLNGKPNIVNSFNGATGNVNVSLVNSVNGLTGNVSTTDLYGIGSFILARPNNGANYPIGTILTGASLYSMSPHQIWSTYLGPGGAGFKDESVTGGNGSPSLVGVGTWRCVSSAIGDGSTGTAGLWVRVG